MSTLISSLIASARTSLNESGSAVFFTDAELLDYAQRGIRDLWRRINDKEVDYFIVIDDTNVTLPANTAALAGVPADVFRVVAVEPRVVGPDNPNKGLIFKPRPYTHPDFVQARAIGLRDPRHTVVFYAVMFQGAPVAAPHIQVAPQVRDAVDLRLVYNQTFAALLTSSANPIPGESDNAVICWIVVYAKARDRDDQAPDPEWLALYNTEKQNLVRELSPRSIQEPEVVEALFEDAWPGWN